MPPDAYERENRDEDEAPMIVDAAVVVDAEEEQEDAVAPPRARTASVRSMETSRPREAEERERGGGGGKKRGRCERTSVFFFRGENVKSEEEGDEFFFSFLSLDFSFAH